MAESDQDARCRQIDGVSRDMGSLRPAGRRLPTPGVSGKDTRHKSPKRANHRRH